MKKEDDMVYSFGIIKHANTRYRESVTRLAMFELRRMLSVLSVSSSICVEFMGGAEFLTFSCDRPLSMSELSFLQRHSSLCFYSEKRGGLLSPLSLPSSGLLPEELPELLKYKGKTNASFTRMMINAALSLTPFSLSPDPVMVLDPLCGKGTTLFSALLLGMNAVGLDTDRKAIREAADYFSRYLKTHGLKHSLRSRSETVSSGSLPVTDFVFAQSKEQYQSGKTQSLILAVGDTSMTPALFRRHQADILVADLPYGVQHAPTVGQKPESFAALLSRALPQWKRALKPEGALAVSFNTLTFPTGDVIRLIEQSGFTPCVSEPFTNLTHEVEHAVIRNAVFALNHKEDSFV